MMPFSPNLSQFHSSSHFSGQLGLVNCIIFLICSQRENKSGRGTEREKVTRHKWLKSLYSIFHFKHRKCESFSIKGYCCCSLAKSCPTICDSWTATCQASQSFTISWSLLKLMSIESVIPSNHLILQAIANFCFNDYSSFISTPSFVCILHTGLAETPGEDFL